MSELKTLKDIEHEVYCGNIKREDVVVESAVLKQAVIEHIKDLRGEKVDCLKYRFANDFAANCFKSFFNITDEDEL